MESQDSPAVLTARLALLALRATVGQSTPLAADRVLLDSANAPMSTDDAARLLAAKPKPLFCDAKAREGMLVVSCRSLSAADASRQPMYEMRRRHEEQYGDFMGFLQDQYGHGDHLVAVFGRDDSLIVPHSVVERWSREYEVEGVGYAADDIDNPWAASEPVYVEARRNGAKGVLRFTSPATYSSFSSSSITLYSDSENVVSAEAEEHLVQMARMNHAMLRGLLDSAADLAGEWHRKQVEAAKEHLRHNVKMMKTVYRGKAMPPDVAAFVEECDNRFGQL